MGNASKVNRRLPCHCRYRCSSSGDCTGQKSVGYLGRGHRARARPGFLERKPRQRTSLAPRGIAGTRDPMAASLGSLIPCPPPKKNAVLRQHLPLDPRRASSPVATGLLAVGLSLVARRTSATMRSACRKPAVSPRQSCRDAPSPSVALLCGWGLGWSLCIIDRGGDRCH
jgi:hypothetical protein